MKQATRLKELDNTTERSNRAESTVRQLGNRESYRADRGDTDDKTEGA